MIHGAMKLLKTGDPCPCCGQPIQTREPDLLYLLSWINHTRRFPGAEDRENIRRAWRAAMEERNERNEK